MKISLTSVDTEKSQELAFKRDDNGDTHRYRVELLRLSLRVPQIL